MSSKHKATRKYIKINKHASRKPSSKLPLILGGIFVVLIIVIFGFYALIRINQVFAANFADNVIRPILGNQITVGIEAVFFGLEDNVNKVKYSFVKSNPSELTHAPITANTSLYRTPGFNLE